jgi:pimeloyl-ACP methyl ester carboxylesterase
MLPLVKPLHDAGFVVMVVALRGSGASQSSGSTFGLLEGNDVKAAISALRKRDYVDTRRIAIVGVGIGANAALMTAQDDPGIRALVLDHPTQLGNQMLITRIGPRNQWFKWMQPMCKWTFELFYQVDADELDLNRYTAVMNSRKTFMVDDHALPGDFRAAPAKNISRFLSANLLPEGVAAVDLKK